MRPGGARIACVAALLWPMASVAADLAYDEQAGAGAALAAETVRGHVPGLDRSLALPTAGAVADAVRGRRSAAGVIPAMDAEGVPEATRQVLLEALDPDLRITGETDIADASGGGIGFWTIVRTPPRMPEQHPDRIVVNVEAPGGSKAFSLVVAGLSKLGFTVVAVASAPLQGKSQGHRYLLAFASDRPVLVLRATDAITRDSRVGEGRAVLIGAWRQGS